MPVFPARLSYFLYILYSYRSALQGMENTIIPMVSGIVELITRVSAALILPHYMGVYGIYLAEVLAWTCLLYTSDAADD